ncbi:MAG: phosphoenolpyruvate carboxylase [Acidimicrobiales bacterium]
MATSDPGDPGHEDDPADAALRADIRRLGEQLGETLTRQEGVEFLELVERVRAAAKAVHRRGPADEQAAIDHLDLLDVPVAIRLVRAFSTYFHLANLAEQVHRFDGAVAAGDVHGWLPAAAAGRLSPAQLRAAVAELDVRPVFTAHPTEATRRTVIHKRRQLARLLVERADPRIDENERRRIDRHVSEVIDLLWQTDELAWPAPHRSTRPPPWPTPSTSWPPRSCRRCSKTWPRRCASTGGAGRHRPATALRVVGGRRSRRQPVRDAGGDARGARCRPPPGARPAAGGSGRAHRGAVGVHPGGPGDRRAAGPVAAAPGAAAGHLGALP